MLLLLQGVIEQSVLAGFFYSDGCSLYLGRCAAETRLIEEQADC